MLRTILSFLLNLRQLFIWRIEHEIYYRIFPHLRKERDFGYVFQSESDIQKLLEQQHKEITASLEAIRSNSLRMPKSYGWGFRYIAYRDLSRRLQQYELMSRRCIQPECDPQFVATKVPTA